LAIPELSSSRLSAAKDSHGSAAPETVPPVQLVSPGTNTRVQVRPPSREAMTRFERPSSWIHAATIRRGARGSTAIDGSTSASRSAVTIAPQGPGNGLAPDSCTSRSTRGRCASAGDAALAATTQTTTSTNPASHLPAAKW
jgi:hypothetical protein